MGNKKKKEEPVFEHPDYEKLSTIEEVEAEVEKHKNALVTKDFVQSRMKEERREFNKTINEQLKEVEEEREHEMGVLSALADRKKQIAANVIPLPTQRAK